MLLISHPNHSIAARIQQKKSKRNRPKFGINDDPRREEASVMKEIMDLVDVHFVIDFTFRLQKDMSSSNRSDKKRAVQFEIL
jgi:hypothetical protein